MSLHSLYHATPRFLAGRRPKSVRLPRHLLHGRATCQMFLAVDHRDSGSRLGTEAVAIAVAEDTNSQPALQRHTTHVASASLRAPTRSSVNPTYMRWCIACNRCPKRLSWPSSPCAFVTALHFPPSSCRSMQLPQIKCAASPTSSEYLHIRNERSKKEMVCMPPGLFFFL